jgi:hypothetical protein
MQHGEEADLGAEMAGISGNGAEGLGGRPKEDPVHDRFVLERDGGDRLRDGEDDVEIFAREQFGRALLDPRGSGERLALRTVAIPTRVVGDALVATRVALLDVAAECSGAARFDGGHHALLRQRECWTAQGTIGVAVAAEDVRHLPRRTVHARASAGWRRDGSRRGPLGPWEQVERAGGRADLRGGDAKIPGGRLETAMAEE